jgi:hypothetical protein
MAETVADTRQALDVAEAAVETSGRERDEAVAATARAQRALSDYREQVEAEAETAAQAAGEAMVDKLVEAARHALDTAATQMEVSSPPPPPLSSPSIEAVDACHSQQYCEANILHSTLVGRQIILLSGGTQLPHTLRWRFISVFYGRTPVQARGPRGTRPH